MQRTVLLTVLALVSPFVTGCDSEPPKEGSPIQEDGPQEELPRDEQGRVIAQQGPYPPDREKRVSETLLHLNNWTETFGTPDDWAKQNLANTLRLEDLLDSFFEDLARLGVEVAYEAEQEKYVITKKLPD